MEASIGGGGHIPQSTYFDMDATSSHQQQQHGSSLDQLLLNNHSSNNNNHRDQSWDPAEDLLATDSYRSHREPDTVRASTSYQHQHRSRSESRHRDDTDDESTDDSNHRHSDDKKDATESPPKDPWLAPWAPWVLGGLLGVIFVILLYYDRHSKDIPGDSDVDLTLDFVTRETNHMDPAIMENSAPPIY